ncbi:MAG: lipid A export permease/ATP-binding protein MsbA [Lysobacteraceae bacterium SCN 69-123]|jgi:subfamily B ATP-binding cassette protein MsbA|uniref:lipid A export permease/ATP-binding protein MsbA n=1 Tax=Stenotrophomonas acidaminiphila TaxID=128780 RepID=UPI00086A2D19|nr:lipid A export permease/ATP-binding protein MsbA [Stenotrophomonas acidaminiphila]MBN8800190.1 lipid A export permease/ATP-binding protein MsbA [Stenotrophomonas acidaminiphila]MDF9441592.1 lipid A export permease/ATP-binding protein MsbA [Stenotrophomonas acidaminiphila]ODU47564.1 MAG: lipid A export permease/ATP-binding protein MsbA [Xanthomonadaceae bacterium SCN 69-123]OJY80236.1 MAG: lipid A export permease/ATP-binding protein MsbA [Stenotrophomonas sp. 69-14]
MSPNETPWQTYRRLLVFAQPYRGLLMMAALGMLIEAAAGGGFLMLMSPITNNLVNPKDINWWMPLAIIGLFLLRGVAGYLTDIGMGKAARSIARDLRVRVLGKYLRLPGLQFDNEPVPSMLVRLGSDSDQVAQAAVDAMKVVLQQSLQVLVSLAAMLWYSWQVTLAIFVLAPPLAWVMNKVAKRYRRISHRIQESGAELLQAADQTLSSHQEVKIYGAQRSELDRYGALADTNLKLAMKVEATRSISSAMVQLIGAVGLAALLLIAGHEAAAGRLSVGDFVSMMLAMMTIIPALKQLTNVQNMTQRGIASAQRLFVVLDAADEPDTGTRGLQRAEGLLEFRDVTARYPGQARPAMEGVSFVARPGTVTAIVGRSGSGKSTLIKLIPRFYEPESGQILLDGHPVQEYRLADLRRQIALVGQQVVLFDGSIAQNIAYGELQDSNAERLQQAIVGANAREFVEQLPQGVDAQVGAKGGRLSGGQRQRLAIARAMLKDAPILILDEATAALDNESERLVQDALQRLMPDRTTLVIAHRLSTIEHADQVLVMDQGRIVERGTHQELLALGGLYEHLYRMQFRERQV